MKHILITGASGFVGCALVSAIHEMGFGIRAAVRVKSNSLPTFIEQVEIGEISPDTNWDSVMSGIDVVIHLAARVHVMQDTANDPLSEFRYVNTSTTLNLAEQAAKNGIKRFIYLSSIKVNGEETLPGSPFTEEGTFIPVEPYALSKYEAEQGLMQLSQQTQMEVVIIRPPLVYGPDVKANFLSMMKWLYKGVPLPFGSIHNKRSLVALDNLIDLIITCIDHPAAANEVFLVSDDEDLSTTELLNRVALVMGKKSRLISVNQKNLEFGLLLFGKKDLAQRLCSSLQVDISKTKRLLDWKPPFSVNDSLKKTARHYLEQQ